MKLLRWNRQKLGQSRYLEYTNDSIKWHHYKNSPHYQKDFECDSGFRTAQNLLAQGYSYIEPHPRIEN